MRGFESFHPAAVLVYFLSVLGIAMFVWNPAVLLLALVGGAAGCLLLCPRQNGRATVWFYFVLPVLTALINPLFSQNGVTELFFINGRPVTLESLLYGLLLGVMLLAVLLWCKCYTAVMTAEKFMLLFGRCLPRLSLVLCMILRLIPHLKRQLRRVEEAQAATGLHDAQGYLGRVRDKGRVFSALTTWSLENAVETSMSMEARGYGLRHRTSAASAAFTLRDAGLLLAVALLDCLILAGVFLGGTQFYFYPSVLWPDNVPLFGGCCLCYGLLVILPCILEGKEWLVWKFCVSKI